MALLTDNLEAYFKFDGDSVDAEGGTYTGTDNLVSYAAGKINNGLVRQSAVDSKVVIPAIPLGRNWAVSLWLSMTGADQNPNPIMLDGSGFGICADPNRPLCFYVGNPAIYQSASNLGTGAKHVVAVCNEGSLKWYLQGVRDGFAFLAPTLNWQPTRFFTANFDTTGRTAWLDEVAVYTRPLSAAGVAALFNAGAGRARSTFGSGAGDFFEPAAVNFLSQSLFSVARPGQDLSAINFLAPQSDLEAPQVTRLSPPEDAALEQTTPVVIEVRDNNELRKVVVHARFPGLALEEVIYRGNGFAPNYATFSTVAITDDAGDQVYTFTIRRTPGWPSSPTIDVIPIDTAGNEAE